MKNYSWVDIDLTRLVVDSDTNGAIIEISSCYDGSDLATIACQGLIVANVRSALALNSSNFPAMVGEVSVQTFSRSDVPELLDGAGYGFHFEGQQPLPVGVERVVMINIRGGEIEVLLIALNFQVIEPENIRS